MDGEAGTLHAQCDRRQDGARDYSVPYGAEERGSAIRRADAYRQADATPHGVCIATRRQVLPVCQLQRVARCVATAV